MGKTIKHGNMLQPNPGIDAAGYGRKQFPCRGCTMRNREEIWRGFVSSISEPYNRKCDNSYLTLEEEPSNPYDPNAVMVVCRGEFFGTVGYVAKEHAAEIKDILSRCSVYRVDMLDENEAGQKSVMLMLTWRETNEQDD